LGGGGLRISNGLDPASRALSERSIRTGEVASGDRRPDKAAPFHRRAIFSR
jgi:hypothetical protein